MIRRKAQLAGHGILRSQERRQAHRSNLLLDSSSLLDPTIWQQRREDQCHTWDLQD